MFDVRRDCAAEVTGDVTFTPNNAEISKLLTSKGGPVARDLLRRGQRVEARAKQLVGVDTRLLRRSITTRLEQRGGLVCSVGTFGGPSYALPHHEGGAPHEIRARNAKTLRFVVGGRTVFVQRVQHPGNRPTRYLTGALDAARG